MDDLIINTLANHGWEKAEKGVHLHYSKKQINLELDDNPKINGKKI